MGAGNYYFAAPAGDEWSRMIYVDLQPSSWNEECERLNGLFQEHLKGTEVALRFAQIADEDEREEAIEKLLEEWLEEQGLDSEQRFGEQQQEDMTQCIMSKLGATFQKRFVLEYGASERFKEALILGEVGRMVIAGAYTYYGDRLALIVTPLPRLHDDIWSFERHGAEFASGRDVYSQAELLARNSQALGWKRTMESGALFEEMNRVFLRMVRGLYKNGLGKHMSIRSCAWTSTPFEKSRLFDEAFPRRTRLIQVAKAFSLRVDNPTLSI